MSLTSLEILEKERLYKEVLQDIKIKQKELLDISSEVDSKKNESGKLSREIIERENNIVALENKTVEKVTAYEVIDQQFTRLQNDLSVNKKLLSKIKKQLQNQTSTCKKNELIVRNSNKKSFDVQHNHSILQKQYDDLLKEYTLLQKTYHTLQNVITVSHKEKESLSLEKIEIDKMIEDALVKFRIFENRIQQFTQDTGYRVGYKIPSRTKKLIVNT